MERRRRKSREREKERERDRERNQNIRMPPRLQNNIPYWWGGEQGSPRS
jgi:hypothetical protein